jgi:2-C-methyl-D-erythritol 4-phosphate cytidylyltransferase
LKIGAIVVGGGSGQRLGAGIPKCFIEIEGVPLLFLSTLPLELSDAIEQITLVVPDGFEQQAHDFSIKLRFNKIDRIVRGGAERQDSVAAGLASISEDCPGVIIHDGARPFCSVNLVDRVVGTLNRSPAAFAACPVSDTLHTNSGGFAQGGPDRHSLVSAQTPQGFHRAYLEDALKFAESHHLGKYTDEISLLNQALGIAGAIMPGESSNIKVTCKEDLQFYAPQLMERAQQLRARL